VYERIELPVRDGFTVNAWLLRGEPLTLVDTGPRIPVTLTALEHGDPPDRLRDPHPAGVAPRLSDQPAADG
jgi:hypothetical protein